MKKTLFAFMALAMAFAATSCQSDEEFTRPANKPMVINAVAEGIGTGTRAEMAYKYDILWSTGDQIYVKNSTSNATFDLQRGAGTTEGTFACTESPFKSGEAVEAYYPASLVQADGSLKWPDKQDKNTIVPMYSKKTLGSKDAESFSFASLGAVLQIVFNSKQEDVTLKSITIKDGSNPLSGAFHVDENGKAIIDATDNAGITLDLGTGKALGKGANYFNIAVPAGTYSNLSIIFTATDGRICTLKGNVTINHNTVGRLALTGTKFKHPEITGTAKRKDDIDVNWVQLWKDGPRFAVYNVGVTDGKAESYGGHYCYGKAIDNDKDGIYYNGNSALVGTDDTATNLWGDNWRMPTKEEFEALLDNCTVLWTTVNGVNGRKFTGKAEPYSSNSVFLPAAGRCYDGSVSGQGNDGGYWSSTPNGSFVAYYLYFYSGSQNVISLSRLSGCSVRAVLAE